MGEERITGKYVHIRDTDRVNIIFDERYKILIDLNAEEVSRGVLERLGINGDVERFVIGINGLGRYSLGWIKQYETGNLEVSIPKRVVNEEIRRKLGIKRVVRGDGEIVPEEDILKVLGDSEE